MGLFGQDDLPVDPLRAVIQSAEVHAVGTTACSTGAKRGRGSANTKSRRRVPFSGLYEAVIVLQRIGEVSLSCPHPGGYLSSELSFIIHSRS